MSIGKLWSINTSIGHNDLKIAPVAEQIQRFAKKHEERHHQNPWGAITTQQQSTSVAVEQSKTIWTSLSE